MSSELYNCKSEIDKAIRQVSDDVSGLSDEFSSYSLETDAKISALQKQVHGGLVCKGALSIDIDSNSTLESLFIANGFDASTPLSVGYFYVAKTLPSNIGNAYAYDGIYIEHGDWVLMKDSCYVSSVTSSDVDVFDA